MRLKTGNDNLFLITTFGLTTIFRSGGTSSFGGMDAEVYPPQRLVQTKALKKAKNFMRTGFWDQIETKTKNVPNAKGQ